MDNKNDIFKEVQDAVLADPVTLPASLQEENIKKMLDEAAPLRVVKNKSGKRRFAALAACAAVFCLCVGGFVAAQNRSGEILTDSPTAVHDTQAPAQTPDKQQPETAPSADEQADFLSAAVTYDKILSLASSFAEKNSYEYKDVYYAADEGGGLIDFFNGFFTSKDDAAQEVIMEDAEAAFGTSSSVMTTAAAMEMAPAAPRPESDSADNTVAGGMANGAATDSAEKTDYGKTNVQVEGVDEADILKNDGENLYLLKGNTLHVIRAYPADAMEELAVVVLKEPFDDEIISYFYANEMFLYNNYVCVILSCSYAEEYTSRTMALVYDISDPANPVFVQRFAQDGLYISSRIADGRLVLVTSHRDFYTYNYTENGQECVVIEDNLIPKVYEGDSDGVSVAEPDLSIADDSNPTAFTVVSLLNMDDLNQPVSSEAVLGGGTEIFCTNKNLFVSRVCYKTREYKTDDAADSLMIAASSEAETQIFSFSFAGGEVTRLATGTVPGRPLNQFSMDEHNGYFRIAVHFDGENDNGLYVLDENLSVVGECEHYGADEQIQSVRFMGDWAYVVTFRQTDPLFVMDLSDPAKPVIAGEVKLPGFSAYLHPIGNGLLLGLGYGGTEDGLDGSAKISLFDVSDPMHPVEADAIVHENASLTTEHKAFCTVSDGSFLIPMYTYGTVNDYGYDVWVQEFGGVLHFAVEDKKLVIRNEFTCTELYSNPNRTTYIGEVAYAVSNYHNPSVYAFDMTDGTLLGTVHTSEPTYAYETSGWKHYVETEAETKYTDSGEGIVVMTSPAYAPDYQGVVVMTTAAPVEVPDVPKTEIAVEAVSPAYIPQTETAVRTTE